MIEPKDILKAIQVLQTMNLITPELQSTLKAEFFKLKAQKEEDDKLIKIITDSF